VIKSSVEQALNKQINMELASAYVYLSMCAYFEDQNLPGFASWMKHQAEEEVEHAMRLFGFVNDRGGRVQLEPIAGPPNEFDSPLACFKLAYEHECKVSASIHEIYALAGKESDYATQTHLHWFIDEQVEEEATAEGILAKLEIAGDNKGALLILDREMGQRGGHDH
jgi:ferritin